MDEGNSYEALYLYNAVIEYMYFLVALIEAEGPKNLANVEKHLKFFNNDIYGFAEIFNGDDLTEKIGAMLCITTPIFNVKERFLNLSLNGECFIRTIYKDLLISKIVDLVLRGICCVKEICHNLNLNNLIRIEEKSLNVILKKYPYFNLDFNNSVTIRQFHGLLGFEDHAYKTVVLYFQSYLQNLNVLTYNDVLIHEKFIPSCAISNPLFLFCVLHVCSIFICENGKIKLRKKFRKKKYGNRIINSKILDASLSKSVPIGLLVSEALGWTLNSWTGEISELTKSTGKIQCVVNFSNEYQGIFVIYMYKTALKHVCETEDLNDYLSIRDIVEFDARYCEEAVDQHIFWQATRIKVIKQSLNKSKYELDVNIGAYMEKIKLSGNSLNVTSKTCSLKNCSAKFLAIENNLSIKLQNKDNSKLSLYLNTQLSSNSKDIFYEKSSNLLQDSSEVSMNKTVTAINQLLPLKDSNEENLCGQENVNDINLSVVGKTHNENNVLILDSLFSRSSFMFGEVKIASKYDGMAVTMNTCKQYHVFFKYEAVLSENTRRIPVKGSLVLLFIPYIESKDSFSVATLVYLLNSEESVLFKESITIECFVMNNFSPTVQKSLGAVCPCFCGFTHILAKKLLIPQNFETKREQICKIFNFVKSLEEAFCFSDKTLVRFYMLIKELHSRNLGLSCAKICDGLLFIFIQAFSLTSCLNKLTILSKGKKTLNNHYQKGNYRSSYFVSTTYSKTSDAAIATFMDEMNLSFHTRSDIREALLIEKYNPYELRKENNIAFDSLQVKPGAECYGSCKSLNSYKSSNSKSSEEVYYSCESIPDKIDSDSGKNGKSILSQSNATHLFKDKDTKNIIICNEMNNSVFSDRKSVDLINGVKDIPKIMVSDNEAKDIPKIIVSKKCMKRFELADSSDFKVRHFSLSKAKNRRIKRRIILPSSSNHCKECWKQMIETTACISTMTNSYLYFCVSFNQQVATLGFPKKLVSEEILKSLSVGSIIKIGLKPNILLHFSDVLYISPC